mgnify:CR=1 FL=1
MVDYIMISGAALCIAGQFTFNKLYEKKIVNGTLHLFLFPVLTAAVSALLIFFLNGFTLRWGSFTAGLAAANAVVSILSLLCGIVVVRYGSVAVYTMFMMMGGMFLPYVFGLIFLDEKATVCRRGILEAVPRNRRFRNHSGMKMAVYREKVPWRRRNMWKTLKNPEFMCISAER